VRKVPNDPRTEIVVFDVTVTSHGPIVFERDSVRYALRWPALDSQASELAAFYAINRARNWKEFCTALQDFPGPAQNFLYADSAGHIGYYGAGKIPIRKTGNGSVPYDGAKDAGDWTGFIPFGGLPHVYDPPSGVVVTANNRIIGRDYPYHLSSDWAPPYRARRILDLLQAKPKLTVEDFRTIQSDTYSISGLAFAREFIRVTNRSAQATKDNNWTETIELLGGWDGYVNASSRAPAILAEIRAAFRRRVLSSVLGPGRAEQASDISNTLFDYLITQQPPEWLPKEFADYGELLRACEKDAREVLTKRLGPDRSQWTWGRISVARFSHPLAGVPNVGEKFIVPVFPVSGSGGNFPTVNVGSSVSMRLIADIGGWDNTQQGIALGQSGDPSSEHWLDQLNDWKSVATRVFPFTKRAVENATRQTIELAAQPR
jgi:penicillin amidase